MIFVVGEDVDKHFDYFFSTKLASISFILVHYKMFYIRNIFFQTEINFSEVPTNHKIHYSKDLGVCPLLLFHFYLL